MVGRFSEISVLQLCHRGDVMENAARTRANVAGPADKGSGALGCWEGYLRSSRAARAAEV